MNAAHRPRRLLVVMPSWVGDCVMATPALRALRDALPGALIGALVRPGLDELLAGIDTIDQFHAERATGMMGPKRVAQRLRMHRYDAAVLLTNSFSTALVTRLAGVPRRVGYDRDARGVLLTDRIAPKRRRDTAPYSRSSTAPNDWAPVPACAYYFELARFLLESVGAPAGPMGAMSLGITPEQAAGADEVLARCGLAGEPFAVLCPGGNNPAKRWPAERFAQAADELIRKHGLRVALSGGANEAELLDSVREQCPDRDSVVSLASEGTTLGTLKGIVRRARLMVTNDTGPRHIAAAFGVPLVTLFGPTDHRWTTIPFDRERVVVADPTLPEEEVANDHPERCAVDRITVERVLEAIASVTGTPRASSPAP